MTVQELITLVENRMRHLESMRKAAWDTGDAQGVSFADAQISQTQLTLDQLRSING